MTRPTRAEKRARIEFYSKEWVLEPGDDPLDPDEMDLAIIADYAPLTPERRGQLNWLIHKIQGYKTSRAFSLPENEKHTHHDIKRADQWIRWALEELGSHIDDEDDGGLTTERLAELVERRQVIERLFERADASVEDNPNIEEYAEERRFFQNWLAEIDAELEGSDEL